MVWTFIRRGGGLATLAVEKGWRPVVAPARVIDTTVRIDKGTSATLDSLAKKKGQTKKDIIAQAVERMRREEILEAANVGYAAMKSDPVAWREELGERALWESTISDGLKGE